MSQFEEAGAGVSKPRVLMQESDSIDDQYNLETEVDKRQIKEDKRDATQVKREEFLSIVKDSAPESQADEQGHDIAKDGVKFKQGDFESGFKLNTSAQPDKKPLITEISSGQNSTQA